MMRRSVRLTVAQKCNKEFESIAQQVVKYLLQGVDADIKRTKHIKDGGYDIVASFVKGGKIHKVYFECKLRSDNLNLRDIAANVIIAFNEGAVGLVALSNYDYTPQLDEQLHQFYNKTIINIKIIIGEEIKKILIQNGIIVSDELLSILAKKKSLRREEHSLLRIDFEKTDLCEQLLYKPQRETPLVRDYLANVLRKQLESTARLIRQGYAISVSGYAGVGKSTFIAAVLGQITFQTVHIDAKLYATQEQLLLDLLMQIWGIPERVLLTSLTKNNIDMISATLGGKENDAETAQIVSSLLNGPGDGKQNSIQYNYLVCRYLLSLLTLHPDSIEYIFCIENFQFANDEISILLNYFIKLLQKVSIGCIIEYMLGEYQLQHEKTLLPALQLLPKYHDITIDIFTQEQAVNFLRQARPAYPETTIRTIVDRVGTRLYNLSMILSYLEGAGIDSGDLKRIACEIDALTPNDIPNLINKLLSFYRKENRQVFDLLAMCHCKAPYELFDKLNLNDEALNRLLDEQIFVFEQGYIIPSNEFIRDEILANASILRPGYVKMAETLLAITAEEPERYQDVRINLLYITGQYALALKLLDQYVERLREQKQYTALIQAFDIAVEISQKQKALLLEAHYLIEQLDVIVIKKEITGPKAEARLADLSRLLSSYLLGAEQQNCQMAFDYFQGKRAFKSGQLNAENKLYQAIKHHYLECINKIYTDNTGDWLGRVCSNYAIFVKELEGNEAALTVFQSALKILPDSFELLREYYSHEACMKLYSAPKDAYIYYEKILQLFEQRRVFCALPFHEYGDKAMSLLLAGDCLGALQQAEQALTLADSYGVLDEVGRITNIKGCAMLCINQLKKAKELFLEATAIMERSGYPFYCWRSQLNYLQMEIEENGNQTELSDRLLRVYSDFKALLSTKIQAMVSQAEDSMIRTREYHALLVFGRCWRLLGEDKSAALAAEFGLDRMMTIYCEQVDTLLRIPGLKVIEDSPYFSQGKIFMIG